MLFLPDIMLFQPCKSPHSLVIYIIHFTSHWVYKSVNKHECDDVTKLRTFLLINKQGQTAVIMLCAMA